MTELIKTPHYTSKLDRINDDIYWELTGPVTSYGQSKSVWGINTTQTAHEFAKMLRSTAAYIDMLCREPDNTSSNSCINCKHCPMENKENWTKCKANIWISSFIHSDPCDKWEKGVLDE